MITEIDTFQGLTELERRMRNVLIQCQNAFYLLGRIHLQKDATEAEKQRLEELPGLITEALLIGERISLERGYYRNPEEPPHRGYYVLGTHDIWPEKHHKYSATRARIEGAPRYHPILGYWVFPCSLYRGEHGPEDIPAVINVQDIIIPTTPWE